MTTWTQIGCYSCDGHGQVADYGCGDDFYGPKECDDCNGSGQISKSNNGVLAQYPGGPFLGRLPYKRKSIL